MMDIKLINLNRDEWKMLDEFKEISFFPKFSDYDSAKGVYEELCFLRDRIEIVVEKIRNQKALEEEYKK